VNILTGNTSMIMKYSLKSLLILSLAIFIISCEQGFDSEAAHLLKAKSYYRDHKMVSSVLELKNVLQKNPKNVEARFLLGRSYLELSDGAGAEKEFRYAINYGNNKVAVKIYLAESLIFQEKLSEAKKLLLGISASTPDDRVNRLSLLANIDIKNNNISAAREINEEIKKLKTETELSLLTQSKISYIEGEYEAALNKINEILMINSNSSKAWLIKARYLENQGEFSDAEKAYLKVLSLEPVRALTTRAAASYALLVLLYAREGESEKANKLTNNLYSLNKKHPLANYLKGLLHFQQKNYTEALDYLQVANSGNSESAEIILLLGATNYALGFYNQSATFLTKYLATNPSNVRVAKLLGAAYLKLEEFDKAIDILQTTLKTTPDDAELLSLVGDAVIKSGNVKKGVLYIRQAMDAGVDTTKGHHQIAAAYVALKDYQSVINELELALTKGEGDYKTTIALILSYIHEKKYYLATRRAKLYVSSHSEEPRAYHLLGSVYFTNNDLSSAAKQFRNAIKLDSKYVPSYLKLAQINYREGHVASAKNELQSVLRFDSNNIQAMLLLANIEEQAGNTSSMLSWIKKIKKNNKADLTSRLMLVKYYIKNKHYDKAQLELDGALVIDPDNLYALNLKFTLLIKTKNYNGAIIMAKRIIQMQKKSPGALVNLATVYIELEDYNKARSTLKKAFALNPDFYPAITSSVLVELRTGNSKQAMKLVSQAQKSNPSSPAGYTLAGDVYLALKKYKQASDAYKTAYKYKQTGLLAVKQAEALYSSSASWEATKKPLDTWLSNNPQDYKAHQKLADLANVFGHREFATTEYKKIIKYQPNNATVLNNLAWTLHTLKKDQEALLFAKQAYNLQKNNPGYQDTYGWILISRGEYAEAYQLLRKAYDKLPNVPDIKYHYAVALHKNGRSKETKELLKELLSTKKSFTGIEEAKRLLDSL